MLQIKIKGERHRAEDDDVLGRTECGYFEGITPEEAWERGRAAWKLKPASVFRHDEVEIIHPDGTVLAVAELTGLNRVRGTGRYVLLGEVKPDDPRIGQPSAYPHPSRNPIAYH